jgi:hypothetical protein
MNLTEAERADFRSYREGWVIEMIRNTKEHASGERLTVRVIEPDGLVVVDAAGRESKLNIEKHAKAFEVCEIEQKDIAIGEQIRVTKNRTATEDNRRLHSGSFHTVKAFAENGDLILENGQTIPRSFGHIAYGVASTSMSAQGMTVDRVLIAESSESFVAANREQFYVSVSRGRKQVMVFTDDREELLEAVHASSERMSATDIGLWNERQEDEQMDEHRSANGCREQLGSRRPTACEIGRQLHEQLLKTAEAANSRTANVEPMSLAVVDLDRLRHQANLGKVLSERVEELTELEAEHCEADPEFEFLP